MSALGVEPAATKLVHLRVMHWVMRGGPPKAPLYLQTTTGRLYRVETVRRARAGSEHRYVFGARHIRPDELPPGARLHDWTWASRRGAPSRRTRA